MSLNNVFNRSENCKIMGSYTSGSTLLESYISSVHPKLTSLTQHYSSIQQSPNILYNNTNTKKSNNLINNSFSTSNNVNLNSDSQNDNDESSLLLKKVPKGNMSSSVRHQFKNTKLCPHMEKGRCHNGEQCTFAHTESQIRPLPDLKFTKLCDFTKQGKECTNPDCHYAHDHSQLKPSTDLTTFKTQPCFFWVKGKCFNKEKCRFAHGNHELRRFLQSQNYFNFNNHDKCPSDQNSDQISSETNRQSSEESYASNSRSITMDDGVTNTYLSSPPQPHSMNQFLQRASFDSHPLKLWHENGFTQSLPKEMLAMINKEDIGGFLMNNQQIKNQNYPEYNYFDRSKHENFSNNIPRTQTFNMPNGNNYFNESYINNANITQTEHFDPLLLSSQPNKSYLLNNNTDTSAFQLNNGTSNCLLTSQSNNEIQNNLPFICALYLENCLNQKKHDISQITENKLIPPLDEYNKNNIVSSLTNSLDNNNHQKVSESDNAINSYFLQDKTEVNNTRGVVNSQNNQPTQQFHSDSFINFITNSWNEHHENSYSNNKAFNNHNYNYDKLKTQNLLGKEFSSNKQDFYNFYNDQETIPSFPLSTGLSSNCCNDFTDLSLSNYLEDPSINSNCVNSSLTSSLTPPEWNSSAWSSELTKHFEKNLQSDMNSQSCDPSNNTSYYSILPSMDTVDLIRKSSLVGNQNSFNDSVLSGATTQSLNSSSTQQQKSNYVFTPSAINFIKQNNDNLNPIYNDFSNSAINPLETVPNNTLLKKQWPFLIEPDNYLINGTGSNLPLQTSLNHKSLNAKLSSTPKMNPFSYTMDFDTLLNNSSVAHSHPLFPFEHHDRKP